jgi:L-cysteine desulfidase
VDNNLYRNYVAILRSELIPALGCTEPIAVAYASATAAKILGRLPEAIEMWCSGNIIKNVKGVIVPNTGGMKGIEVAAIAGAIGGDPDRGLEVLEPLKTEQIEAIKRLTGTGYCISHLLRDSENLHIIAGLTAGTDSVTVEIRSYHTNITKITQNDRVIMEKESGADTDSPEKMSAGDAALLTVKDILEFADTLNPEDVRDLFERQIVFNTAIAEEGLKHNYGADVGKTLLKFFGNSVNVRAVAKAAAGSDARMDGCCLPVVINSGSGNQGMTASLPVIEFANEMGVSRIQIYRALAVSNLIAIHQKKHLGRLSAYCGVVSAACGSAAAITYLHGGEYADVARTITNMLADVSGIVCDGAKPSCAMKIASAVEAAVMAHYLSFEQKTFAAGDGLVKEDVEKTIRSIYRMGKDGMKETDIEILNIMLES